MIKGKYFNTMIEAKKKKLSELVVEELEKRAKDLGIPQ
jgi:hypothetical protein